MFKHIILLKVGQHSNFDFKIFYKAHKGSLYPPFFLVCYQRYPVKSFFSSYLVVWSQSLKHFIVQSSFKELRLGLIFHAGSTYDFGSTFRKTKVGGARSILFGEGFHYRALIDWYHEIKIVYFGNGWHFYLLRIV